MFLVFANHFPESFFSIFYLQKVNDVNDMFLLWWSYYTSTYLYSVDGGVTGEMGLPAMYCVTGSQNKGAGKATVPVGSQGHAHGGAVSKAQKAEKCPEAEHCFCKRHN